MADDQLKEKKSKSSHRLKDKSSESSRQKDKDKETRKSRRKTVAIIDAADLRSGAVGAPADADAVAAAVVALLRPEIQKLIEMQKTEIQELKVQIQQLNGQLGATESAGDAILRKENEALKKKVAELEEQLYSKNSPKTQPVGLGGLTAGIGLSAAVSAPSSPAQTTATDVLNNKTAAPLTSLTASRPRVGSRKPSAHPGLSNSSSTNALDVAPDDKVQSTEKQAEKAADKPSTANIVAAAAVMNGLALATASVSASNGAVSITTTSQPAAPDEDEIDRRSLSDDEIEAIRELFGKYDINNDGVIDRYEFELILEDLRKSDYMSNKISDGIFKKFVSANWDQLDSDKNGSVDLQEFINFVASSKAAGNMFTKPLNLKLKKESQRNLNARITPRK